MIFKWNELNNLSISTSVDGDGDGGDEDNDDEMEAEICFEIITIVSFKIWLFNTNFIYQIFFIKAVVAKSKI